MPTISSLNRTPKPSPITHMLLFLVYSPEAKEVIIALSWSWTPKTTRDPSLMQFSSGGGRMNKVEMTSNHIQIKINPYAHFNTCIVLDISAHAKGGKWSEMGKRESSLLIPLHLHDGTSIVYDIVIIMYGQTIVGYEMMESPIYHIYLHSFVIDTSA